LTYEESTGPAANPAPSHWFAVYTTPRHEKRVNELMAERCIETYLPLYHSERAWKKRAPVVVELPLFPTYVFARIPSVARGVVLSTPGVLAIVGNGTQAVSVPEAEIETLRSGLHLRQAEPHPYLAIGERVRIKTGPLAGMEGILVRKRANYRVVLAMTMIMRSVSVEIDLSDIEPAECEPLCASKMVM
jgi:transcriptional antiterminator NusG